MVYWITGKAGSGKTTFAQNLKLQREARGKFVVLLDGDEFREVHYPELGFTKEDIQKHLVHMATVAARRERNGFEIIIACVSPYREFRHDLQDMFQDCVEIELRGGKMWAGTKYESTLWITDTIDEFWKTEDSI